MKDEYPIYDLLSKYIPVKYIPAMYHIPLSVVENLIATKQLNYAEMKDPEGYRRIPFVNIEDLLELVNSDNP